MGLEALMILRAEKGDIVAGKDTDGMTIRRTSGSRRRATRGRTNNRQALAVHAGRQRPAAASNSWASASPRR